MNMKEEMRERSHQTILDSAARLVRKRGISAARVADVMKGAGLTVGGFYVHFASKKALIDETLRRTARQMRGLLFGGLDGKPPADRAEVVLKRYLSAAHRDETTPGCPFPAVVGEVGTTATEHRQVLGEQVEAMASELEALVPQALAVRPRDLALGLVALMYGGLTLSRALRKTELSHEMLRACRAVGRIAARPDTEHQ